MKRRILLPGFLFIFFLGISYILILRISAQIYHSKGLFHIEKKEYRVALSLLEKALSYYPRSPEIYQSIADAYYPLAAEVPFQESPDFLNKAKKAYLEAFQLNPIRVDPILYAAIAEARLEFLYPFFNTGNNPHNAMPYFKEAVRLTPEMPFSYKPFARYLYQNNETELLKKVVTEIVRVYPAEYGGIKKEAYWSPEIKQAAKKGLLQAIDQGIDPYNAYGGIISILSDEKDWAGVLMYHSKRAYWAKRLHPTHFNDSRYYFEQGRLQVENGLPDEAEKSFLTALHTSKSPKKTLNAIYTFYKRKNNLESFIRICDQIKTKNPNLADEIESLIARSLTEKTP